MKIYPIITKNLDKFRTRSLTHPISFMWNGSSMILYQNGSKFTLKEIFSGCIMPNKIVRGLILPEELDNLLDIQQYVDDNINDLIISPAKWGYDIYRLNPKGPGPLLVKELRFYSIKGAIPNFIASLWDREIRIALKNVK
jgi:hypothetical protein